VHAAIDAMPIDQFVFERPVGRRHFIEARADSIVIASGGCEIEIEAEERHLVEKIFDLESFTAADLRAWQPGLNVDEAAPLLRALIRSGLLDARPIAPAQPSAAR
jgi:hypothetical protein